MTAQLFITVIELLLVSINGIITFFTFTKNPPKIYKKIEKKSFFVSLIITAISIVFSVLGISGIAVFSTCKSVFIVFSVICVIFIALNMLKDVIPENYKELFSFTVKTTVVVLMIEATVFNFNTYDFLSRNYDVQTLSFSNAVINDGNLNENSSISLYSGSIEFTDINIPIGSITVDVSNRFSASTTFNVSYADETNSSYRSPIVFSVINNNVRSKTTYCSFSGKVSKLLFTYTEPANSSNITIKSITLNNPIEMEINPVRVLILLFFSILCYSLLNLKVFRKPVKNSEYAMQMSTFILSVLFVYLAFFSITIYRSDNNLTLDEEFSLIDGNQMTYEMVDAFKNGKVELDIPVDESLAELQNPYDWSQRRENNAIYSWDHVYYNGHYYSYYGIAPVILLFLPYHLLTNYYFPTTWAVIIFTGIGIVFLIKLFNNFIKKYFREIPFGMSLSACIITLSCCSVWFNLVTPNFYEIAQTSGFACITSGSFFMITSNITEGKNIIYWKLTLSSILLSLSVLCRPTLAVYCIVALLFIIFGFLRLKENLSKNNNKKIYIKYLTCTLFPFIIIGSVQMIYNYMRFGSVLDFGINYSLTINDFTRVESHISQILIGFINFLFVFPVINTDFPFIHSNFTLMNLKGYYFVANLISCGILFKALPTFSYIHSIKAYRLASVKYRNQNTILLLATCVIAPFIIIFSIAESGYGVRYATDFAWQIVIGAFTIVFIIYSNIKNEQIKKILYKLLIFSMLVSIVIGFSQMYEYHLNNLNTIQMKSAFLNFAYNFEFWK